MQSHKCAFLDQARGDRCRSDEHCQYKLTTACYPQGPVIFGPVICGKDQIIAIDTEVR